MQGIEMVKAGSALSGYLQKPQQNVFFRAAKSLKLRAFTYFRELLRARK